MFIYIITLHMDKKKYFWIQREYYPKGYGYGQFSKTHVLVIIFVILFSFLMSYIYGISNIETKSLIRIIIASILMFLEVFKIVVLIINKGDVINYLPLEMCSFGAYFIVVDAILKNNNFITEMLLIAFIPAAVMAILFPTTIDIPLFSFCSIHQFVYHYFIIAYIMMRFINGEIFLHYIDVIKTILVVSSLAFIIYLVDLKFKHNHMFLIEDDGIAILKSIMKFSGAGHKYRICLVVDSILAINVFYFIFKTIEILFIH